MAEKGSLNLREIFFKKDTKAKKIWKSFDHILWVIPILLVFLSGILIASTQRQANYADWYLHWLTGAIGIILASQIAKIPLGRIRPFLIPLYILSLISLAAVKVIGVSALGAQRWLSLGFINIQPSEIAKLVIILSLASVLEKPTLSRNNIFILIKPILLILPSLSLVFIQPDLGTSLVFAAILLTMFYWSGIPIEWILLAISAILTAILSGILSWSLYIWIPFLGFLAFKSLPKKFISTSLVIILQTIVASITPWLWINGLKDYQRDRLVLFLDPSKDPLGGGYHLLQSTVGIGSGGIFGSGLLKGQLTKLRFIPEQHTDFIFSALGEEMGFFGSLFLIICFSLLIIRLLKIAKKAHTDFESLVVIGISSMLFFQIVVNIFMTIGLGPVTGIPLPFMSYGRTALMVNFMSIGLCASVARRASTLSNKW